MTSTEKTSIIPRKRISLFDDILHSKVAITGSKHRPNISQSSREFVDSADPCIYFRVMYFLFFTGVEKCVSGERVLSRWNTIVSTSWLPWKLPPRFSNRKHWIYTSTKISQVLNESRMSMVLLRVSAYICVKNSPHWHFTRQGKTETGNFNRELSSDI